MAAGKDRYQPVFVKVWTGESFAAVSERARLLFLFLLTCPQTTLLCGVVVASVGTIAHALRWSESEVREHMAELAADGTVAFDEAGVVWLPNALTYNPPDNPSIVTGWRNFWGLVPACPLKASVWDRLHAFCTGKGAAWLAAFEGACKRPGASSRPASASPQKPAVGHRVGHGVGDRVAHQYQEQNQEQKQENYYNNYSALPRMHMRTSDPLDTDSGDDLVVDPETGEPVRLVAPFLATDGADAPVAVSTPETPPPPTPRSPELPPSVAAVPPAAPTAHLPPSCPETAPPAASEVRDQGATRPAPDAAVSGAPRALFPGEAYLLALLESHPSLARIALPDVVAMSAGSIDMPGGPTREDAAAAMADLAEVAAAAAAVGEPIRAPELARKVRSFLDNARRRRASRPASVRPAGGATSLAPASPPRRPPPPLPTGPAVPPPPAALAALARLSEKLRAPRPETFAERKAKARAQVTATARAMGVL
jgi:hypothetical protein